MAGKLRVDQITNLNETGYITITSDTGLDLSQATSGLVLPRGTTAQRPSNPTIGSLRYNTTTKYVEYFNGTSWVNSDGSITAVTSGELTLVYTITNSGTSTIASPSQLSLETISKDSSGVALVPYETMNSSVNWQRVLFTSLNKPWVQWRFDRSSAIENILKAMLSPYSSWGNYVSVNGTYGVTLGVGSSIGVGGAPATNFQHNNGGGEGYDILTLGNSGTVWSTGMYWGQIDDPSNYGGFLNTVYPHSGSGGGNTGDKLLIYVDTASAPTPSQFVNYLLPNGPYGNAQSFTWTYSGTSGLGGNPTYLADGTDATSSGNWPTQGFQQAGNDNYIQVQLPSAQSFDYTFAIGYVGSSHMSNQNEILGSNDGSSWTKMAEWSYHNGSGHSYVIFTMVLELIPIATQ